VDAAEVPGGRAGCREAMMPDLNELAGERVMMCRKREIESNSVVD
jgi:hypothetical protein